MEKSGRRVESFPLLGDVWLTKSCLMSKRNSFLHEAGFTNAAKLEVILRSPLLKANRQDQSHVVLAIEGEPHQETR